MIASLTWTAMYAMDRPVTDVRPILLATFFLVLGFVVRRLLAGAGSSASFSSMADEGDVKIHLNV